MFCRVCASAYLRGGGGGPCRYAGAACVTLVPARRVWHGAAVCVACYVTGLACRLEQHGHTRDGKSATAAASATFSRVQARSSSSVRPSATCFVRTSCTRSVRSKPVLSGDLSCRNLSRRAGACCLSGKGETCSPCQRPACPDRAGAK